MWRTRLSKVWDWLKSRRLVGEDDHHLYYSEFIQQNKPDRRYVEYKDKNILHSSDRMSVEWWAWLHNRRDTIPTDLEIKKADEKRRLLAMRVAALEAEDEKQRLRQFSGAPMSPLRSEAEARRRKKAMMRLSQAASPSANEDSGVEISAQVSIRAGVGETETRNTEEEPQVSSFHAICPRNGHSSRRNHLRCPYANHDLLFTLHCNRE